MQKHLIISPLTNFILMLLVVVVFCLFLFIFSSLTNNSLFDSVIACLLKFR